jgi:acetyltransferase-like isoleucine patch superfamily enzyme/acyl carrier protein
VPGEHTKLPSLTTAEIERRVRSLLAVALSLPETQLTGEVRQDRFSEWTSLNHLALMLALEEAFGLTFTAGEMTAMTSLDRIVETVRRHVSGPDTGAASIDASLAAFEAQLGIAGPLSAPLSRQPVDGPQTSDIPSVVARPRATTSASSRPEPTMRSLCDYARSPGESLTKGREWLNARWQLRSCQAVGRFTRVVGRIKLQNWGTMIVGSRVVFLSHHARSILTTYGDGRLTIGDNTTINYGVDIAATGSVTIGANVMIGTHVSILDNDFHELEARDTMPRPRPVVIEDNVWIGNRAIIMPGVTIGEGAAVGAGSVVIADVPPRTLAMGNPARIVRQF